MGIGTGIVIQRDDTIRTQPLAEPTISDVALDFFVRLRAPSASEAERLACARWLAADPAHRAAWEDAETLWSELDRVDVADMARAGERPGAATAPGAISRRQIWRYAAAAAVAGGGIAAWTMANPGPFADYRTASGERRPIALPDGSTATLDARSALSLAFRSGSRGATLHAGVGYFDVAAGGQAFLVSAGAFSVAAAASSFEVRHENGAQVLAVAAGEAAVKGADGRTQRLGPGYAIRQVAGRLSDPHPVPREEIAAWRQDRIIFRRTPLGDVAAELERYRPGYLVVTDADLAAREVSGVFDSRRTDQALETIAATMSAKLLRISDFVVLIQPAA